MNPEEQNALQTLLEVVQPVVGKKEQMPFRLPVSGISEDGLQVSGVIASGEIARGERIVASLSDRDTYVDAVFIEQTESDRAASGDTVRLCIAEKVGAEVGDLLIRHGDELEVADQFAAHVLWLDSDEMLPERAYGARINGADVGAQITDLVHIIDPDTQEHLAAKTLARDDVGYCKLAMDHAVACDAYVNNPPTGIFTLVDPESQAALGVGIVDFALRRASNIEWHDMKVDKASRARANQQKPCVLWFTGLSGSGKSTVADRLEQKLQAMGKRTYLLDGDNVRHGLNKDLGFTDQDRVENIRRVAEVAKLMVDAGLIVITSFISPFRAERQMARDLMEEGEFVEVFVDTPLEICERRDPKGLYKKARSGALKNFTGIDSDYEVPNAAEVVLKAGVLSPDQLVDEVVGYLGVES